MTGGCVMLLCNCCQTIKTDACLPYDVSLIVDRNIVWLFVAGINTVAAADAWTCLVLDLL